jgi:hypothetical protein
MEDFGSRDWDSDEFSRAKVVACDVFVCIVGARHGSSPEGSESSYTEREYDTAGAAGKPRLVFLTAEDFPVPANLMEPEGKQEKQRAFRERVSRDRVRATFRLPAQLAQEIVQAIHNWAHEELAVQRQKACDLQTVTRLLFPFVTNRGGFETGISIANISRDPFGTAPQAGLCRLFYYGETVSGPTPSPQVPGVVPAGGQLMFTLSGGNALQQVAATPGFQGYLVAVCDFPAQGFAIITDGFGGVPTIATAYIATLMSLPNLNSAEGSAQGWIFPGFRVIMPPTPTSRRPSSARSGF